MMRVTVCGLVKGGQNWETHQKGASIHQKSSYMLPMKMAIFQVEV